MSQAAVRINFILESTVSPHDYGYETIEGATPFTPVFIVFDRAKPNEHVPYEGRVVYQNSNLSFFQAMFLDSQIDGDFYSKMYGSRTMKLVLPREKSVIYSMRIEDGTTADRFTYIAKDLMTVSIDCVCGAVHTSSPWSHADWCKIYV